MSVHGVGPSIDYNAGPQSQPPTTRTTPDSGLGGDERGMHRPPPQPYYQQNHPGHPNQQMYQMSGHSEQQQLGYFAQDSYKRQMNNGTTYFVGENGQNIPQEVYNRMQMARGQPPMQLYQQDHQDSAYSHSSTPSQSTTNPAMMNGPPIQMTPNGPMMMSQNGQPHFYYDGIPPNGGVATSRQPNQSYDNGEMAPPQQQQFVAPPQNFHQPPPNLYQQQQQHPAQYANGHPIQQPAGPPHLVRATLMMQRKNEQLQYAQQQGYPPQMVPQMVNPQVYMMAPYIRNPNHPAMRAPHDQQQFVPSGVMASQYYALHPPNIAQQMMQPQFFQQQNPFGYQIYRGGQFKKGGYARSSGRGMSFTNQISHFPIDRFIPGTVAAEVRPETAPPVISQESTSPQIKELANTLTQLEIAPEPIPPKDLQSIQLLQIAAQPEEEEKSEPEEPKEIPLPAAEILKEPTPETLSVEAEPPKPAEYAAPTRVCQYCKTQNKPVEEYTNHVLKENQKVVCPDALLTMACSFCGQVGGEDAHTIVSCPRKKRGEKSVPQTPQRDPSRESVRSNAQREELRQDVRQFQRGGGGGGYQQKQGGYRDGERFQQRDGYKKNYRGGRGQNRGGYSDTGRGRTFNQTSRQQSAQN